MCLAHNWEVSWIHIGFLTLKVTVYLWLWLVLFTYGWIFICSAWLRDPRASAWYSVVLHLLNVFQCWCQYYTFTMWMKGLFKSGELPKSLKAVVLTTDEFHCTKIKKWKWRCADLYLHSYRFSYLPLTFSFSPLWCVWGQLQHWCNKRTASLERPPPSVKGEPVLSLTTEHKQMGYHCPSCHLVQCQVQNW